MAFSGLIDATKPLGSEQRNLADDYMRAIKVAFSERLAIEHSCADDANDGRHLLSTKFHLTGTYAAMPAVDASYPGRLYRATNASTTVSPAIYYDTGTAWAKIATSDHGCLDGLTDDDHTQYLLVSGARSATGHILPATTNSYNLGSASYCWCNVYTVGLAALGNSVFGDDISDTITFTGRISSGLVPSADATYSLGQAGNRWHSVNLSSNLIAGGYGTFGTYVTVGSTLGVAGATTLSSSLAITGKLSANGDVDLGDSNVDAVRIYGKINYNLIPVGAGGWDIGSGSDKWGSLSLAGNANIDGHAILGTYATIGSYLTVGTTLDVTGVTTLSSNLIVKGDTTIGDATTDTMICTARIGSNLVPNAATFDLGGNVTENKWRNLFLSADSYSVNARVTTAVLPSVATATIGITGTRFNYGYFNYIETTNNINAGSFTGATLILTGDLYMKNGQELIFNYLDGNDTFFRYDLSAHKLYLYVDGVLKESW